MESGSHSLQRLTAVGCLALDVLLLVFHPFLVTEVYFHLGTGYAQGYVRLDLVRCALESHSINSRNDLDTCWSIIGMLLWSIMGGGQ